MSSVAHIKDGQVINNQESTKVVNEATSSLDKDDFLQLLVAEMKYQDPLEPTSNTEYIAQYATFAEVEQLQNMSSSMQSQAAMTLAGRYVTVDVVDSETNMNSQVSGRVDYIEKSGDSILLYIDGQPYNYDNLNTVWDEDYLDAYNLAEAFAKEVVKYKDASTLTPANAEGIANLRKTYESMSPYQRSFIGDSVLDVLKAAEEQMRLLGA